MYLYFSPNNLKLNRNKFSKFNKKCCKCVNNMIKCLSNVNIFRAEVAERQTHTTQNRAGNHVGSSPTFGTKHSRLLPTFFLFLRCYAIAYDSYLLST